MSRKDEIEKNRIDRVELNRILNESSFRKWK